MTHFGSIFPIFGAKKIFMENRALSHTTSYGFLESCQNLGKVNYTIQRKCPDGWMVGQKDGQTLFYRTLPATTGTPIINIFIIEQIQWPNFSLNSKNYFWRISLILGAKTVFQKNQVVMHNFLRVSSTLAKSREI